VQEGNPAGQRLVAGRYAVLDESGRGGIGVVWRAHDQVIGRQIALKEPRIPPRLGRQEHDSLDPNREGVGHPDGELGYVVRP